MSEHLENNIQDQEYLAGEISVDAMRAVFALGQIHASETIHLEVDAASSALDAAIEGGESEEQIAQLRKNVSYWKQVQIGYDGTHVNAKEE